jgi:hypothetical protein
MIKAKRERLAGALEVFGPCTRGMRGGSGPVYPSNVARDVAFQLGDNEIVHCRNDIHGTSLCAGASAVVGDHGLEGIGASFREANESA